MRNPFRLTLRKGRYMGADTPLPENACRKEGYRRMYSVHFEQKPYIVPLPLMHIRLSIYLLKKEATGKKGFRFESYLTGGLSIMV